MSVVGQERLMARACWLKRNVVGVGFPAAGGRAEIFGGRSLSSAAWICTWRIISAAPSGGERLSPVTFGLPDYFAELREFLQ